MRDQQMQWHSLKRSRDYFYIASKLNVAESFSPVCGCHIRDTVSECTKIHQAHTGALFIISYLYGYQEDIVRHLSVWYICGPFSN